jgi:hypothetical protein
MNNNENSRIAGSQSETETQTQPNPRFRESSRRTPSEVGCRDPHSAINPPPNAGPSIYKSSDASGHGPASPTKPRYALRKGLGMWQVTYDGEEAVIKHEQGMYYVAYLMLNPPAEPIHGLALYLRTNAMFGKRSGVAEMLDPDTGRPVPVDLDAVVQERALGIDDAHAAAALRRKLLELEAIIDDPETTEPVREEALRDSKAIYEFERRHPWRTRRTAQKTADTVGKALSRLYKRLHTARDARGNPEAVLQKFAEHIRKHLLIPSGRAGGHGGFREEGFGGCFTYIPPAGVQWE